MNDIPATLGEAIASEPVWLVAWLMLLVGAHFLSIVFVPYRHEASWKFRWEPFAIIGSFMIAGSIMEMLYAEFGYVRLLGLAHIIGWAPIYAWMLYQRRSLGLATWWGRYVHLYLIIAGMSLVIDSIDTIRFVVGDSESLYLRWQ